MIKKYEALHNKRILVRADLNIPLVNQAIEDDYRLKAIMPLLDVLLKNNNIIILATHIGRPKGKKNEALSTQLLIPWFKEHGYSIIFEPDILQVRKKHYKPGTIVLLENLRFYPGEQTHDAQFAQQLANCTDYYINDAFALLHRDDTSITDVPAFFDDDKQFYGPLIQQELNALKHLKHPKEPYVVLLGGGKISTKLPVIKNLLEVASTIVLLPAIVFTFLKAKKKEIGRSLVDDTLLDEAKNIIHASKTKKANLMFPLDYQVALDSLEGPLKYVDADKFPENGIGVSIGPKTLKMLTPLLNDAQTIFCNAAMGFATRPETMEGTYALLKLTAASNAYTIIGGGNTVSAARTIGLEDKFSYCSTGGGATLSYLAGERLPGLKNRT